MKLKYKLFLSFALLSIFILLAAAWVINSQVVSQASQGGNKAKARAARTRAS